MKKAACLFLLVAMLAMAAPAFADPATTFPVSSMDPDCSDGLEAQQTQGIIDLELSIAPTIWLGASKNKLTIPCLNPLDKLTGEDEVTITVKSNVPFYKYIQFANVQWAGKNGNNLSYRPLASGLPNPTKVKISSYTPQYWGPDTIDASKSKFYVDGVLVEGNTYFSGDVPIGDADNHIDEEVIKWEVGPIDWCDTAGYYTGNFKVLVYQN
jgi:hypothetical protein